jgi:hypothetical protein
MSTTEGTTKTSKNGKMMSLLRQQLDKQLTAHKSAATLYPSDPLGATDQQRHQPSMLTSSQQQITHNPLNI